MCDVVILKAAHHMDNGVYLPDMGEKFVAQTLALDAPLTSPAMSTNSMVAGVNLSGWYILPACPAVRPAR